MLEDVSSSLSGKYSEHRQFAVTSQKVSSLVELLNFLVVIHVLIVIVDEDMVLDVVFYHGRLWSLNSRHLSQSSQTVSG